MLEQLHHAEEIAAVGLEAFPEEVLAAGRPFVFRGAVRHWPFVREGVRSDEAAAAYLARFYNGRPVSAVVGSASDRGRFFYREDSKRMNFQQSSQLLPNILEALLQQKKTDHPLAIAMQAVSAPDCLPGLEHENPTPLVPERTRARVWIGNAVTVAPHFDVADNLACVVAGRRRFILFPPDQTANLYPGPMDITPANVPISMVSLDEPEFERFPRYREALDSAFVAELEPGDAVYIPYLWWHGVQSLSRFNVLMNYWWNRKELDAGYPYGALLHLAYVLYRDMSPDHRAAWRSLYDHYVFQTAGDPMKPISPQHRDSDGRMEPARVAKLKQALRDLLG